MDLLVLKLTPRSLEVEIALDQINLSLVYSDIALLIFLFVTLCEGVCKSM